MFSTNNQPNRGNQGGKRGSNFKITVIIGLAMAAFSLMKYYSNEQVNPITGEVQRVALTTEQEIVLGLNSAPTMIKQFGGMHPDQRAQELVKKIGTRLVSNSIAKESKYPYNFHLLADDQIVNAFALPGGQIFITAALFSRLEDEDQLAGVLGHEIGHVIHRHSAERMAKMELTQGLTGAAVVAAGDYNTAQAAQMIGNMINMKYGRDQELASDDIGVRLMLEAGYKPEALIGVMNILEKASGGKRQSEFTSTHPSPENRREKIMQAIRNYDQKNIQ